MNVAICKMRERNGLAPISDPLPDERENVSRLIKNCLFPADAGASSEPMPISKTNTPINERITMNEITKIDDDDDGFGGSIANSRFIRGQILRWSDTGGWSDRDGLRPPEELLVLACNEGLQRWKGKKAESITTKPLPYSKELNASVPVAEWEPGIDGKLKPPWAHVAIVYLIDPRTAGTVHVSQFHHRRAHRLGCVAGKSKDHASAARRTSFGARQAQHSSDEDDELRHEDAAGIRDRRLASSRRRWREFGGGSGPKVIQGPKAIENCPPEHLLQRAILPEKGPPLRRSRSLLRTRRSPSWRKSRFPPYRRRWTTSSVGDRSIVDARGATDRPSLFILRSRPCTK